VKAAMKPYPEYKVSGHAWLGDVPKHWEVLPNRALFAELKERNHPDEEMLSVTITKGIIRQKALLEGSSKKDSSNLNKSAYKLVCPHDLAYNKMRAWQGSIGISDFRGIVSPAYVVMRLRNDNIPGYFHHLYRTPYFAKEAEQWSYGITSDMWSLRPEHFRMIYSPLPQHDEQAAIVRFLNHTNLRIEKAIRAKGKLIALLNEQRQAIIHRAVTRGLDPGVRLKHSGVAWLGDIPEHWKVMPLQRITVSRCDGPFGSGLKSSHYTDQGIRVIRLQNIGHAEFKDSDTAFISPSYYATLGDHTVEPEDLLIAGLGDERHPAGRACVAPSFIVPAMVKADCFRFRLFRQRLEPRFAALHLTATAVAASSLLSTGATRQRTNLQTTVSRSVVVPPIQEQLTIIEHITNETSSLRLAISSAEREILLLREYRTRLIADVVTGKLDVREAARRLPDEAEELKELQSSEDDAENLDPVGEA